MSVRVFFMLGLAVLFGTVAVVAGNIWLNRQAALHAGNTAAPQELPVFETIIVAREPLRFGAVLSKDMLKEVPWPSEALPEGAFPTVRGFLEDGQRVVLRPMDENEPVLAAKVTGAGDHAALSRVIGEGNRAVTIRVDDVAGVAGFIVPGDRVDVVMTRDNPEANNASEESLADVILQNVRVLSIDQSADETQEEPVVVDAVTLEVDTAGAQKLALAASIGDLSLVLRRAGDIAQPAAGTITLADLASGEASGDSGTAVVWVSRQSDRRMVRVPTTGRVNAEANAGAGDAPENEPVAVPVSKQDTDDGRPVVISRNRSDQAR